MIERLFVYGTLAPGQSNEKVLNIVGGSWEAASVTGKLLSEGWGAKMGCPGLKLDKKADKVQGFVFSSENFSNHWQRLDEFEGEEYCRVLTKAELGSEALIDVYIYTLK